MLLGAMTLGLALVVRLQPATDAIAQERPMVSAVESPTGTGAAEANLTVGADGKVYLSWMEPAPDSAMALRFASFDGAKWSEARTIRSGRDFFVNWADFPSMSVQSGGRMAAHWLQRHGTSSYAYDVRIASSTDGGKSWGAAVAPHADKSATEKGFVTIWREGNGFGVVWLDGRKADKSLNAPKQEMMLYTAGLSANGTPGAEVQLDNRSCDCCQTTAVMTSNGPIVAYRDRTEKEIRDIYVTRRVRGQWTEGKAVYNDGWEINACPVNGPFLDASGQKVVLAWFTGANNAPRVKVAFSNDAGATFSAPITVDDGNPAGRVAAVLLDDGSAIVSWLERTKGDTASVRARRVRAKEGVGAAVTIAASSAARASGFPRMVRVKEQLYFAWTQPGRPSAVKMSRTSVGTFK
jgi:hypothetical protein